MIGTIKATQDTWLKILPIQSSDLAKNDKQFFEKDQELKITWMADDEEAGHRKLDLNQPLKGRFAWYCFVDHWDVLEATHPKLLEFEASPVAEYSGKKVIIPTLGERFLDQPVDGCQNFSWGELTHGGTRIPNNSDMFRGLTQDLVVQNLIKISKQLEQVRKDFGNRPVKINSGYRPPSVNSRVGGSSQSRHLYGDAVDFVIQGVSTWDVFNHYNPNFVGGLASSNSFTHMDLRGCKARWSYN
jgi:hypothetical protein